MRRAFSSVAALAVLAGCSDTLPVEHAAPAPRFTAIGGTTNRYVILLSSGVPQNDFAGVVSRFGGTVVNYHADAGFAVVDGLTPADAAALARSRSVKAVEPDFEAQIIDPSPRTTEAAIEGADVGITSQANPATAFFFPRQWHHRAIGAHTAWAAGALGSASVSVAILDSGIDHLYPDLVGLVDLNRSASFVATNSTNPQSPSDDQLLATFFPGSGRPLTSDLNGHGTHVASTVSSKATVNAGVTSRVTLMAVKVANARGSAAFSAILNGVVFAVDHGADVINMSLGAAFLGHGGYIGFLNQIARYATANGVTVVVSAGNEGIDLDHSGGIYSAFCSNGMVICVSATGPHRATTVNGPYFDDLDESAIYTNFGTSSVEVAAPGGNWAENAAGQITSAVGVWAACSKTSLDFITPPQPPPPAPPVPPFYQKTVCAQFPQFSFTLGLIGTSMASPHVAGVAALLVERVGRNPGQIRTILQNTADDLGKPGADPRYGKGRINVARALGGS